MSLFFRPWYKEHLYKIGIKGKRILVVGASHYCKQTVQCPYFEKCTNRELKDSSEYNKLCPFCDIDLSHSTIETIEYFIGGEENRSYRNFSDFMISIMKLAENDTDLWEHIAFMNYVQFILGGDGDIDTNPSDISARDYSAFEEVVNKLHPDLIIVWGTPVGNELKKYRVNRIEVPGANRDYIFDLDIGGKTYLVINSYHPSYGNYLDGGKLENQLKLLL